MSILQNRKWFYRDESAATCKKIKDSCIVDYKLVMEAGTMNVIDFRFTETPKYYDGSSITLAVGDAIMLELFYDVDTKTSYQTEFYGLIDSITYNGQYIDIRAYSHMKKLSDVTISSYTCTYHGTGNPADVLAQQCVEIAGQCGWSISGFSGSYSTSNLISGNWVFKNVNGLSAWRHLLRKGEDETTGKILLPRDFCATGLSLTTIQWNPAASAYATLSHNNKGIVGKVEWEVRREDYLTSCTVVYKNGATQSYNNGSTARSKTLYMPELTNDTDASKCAQTMVKCYENGRTIAKFTSRWASIFPSGATNVFDAGVGIPYSIVDVFSGTTKTMWLRKVTIKYPGILVECEFDTHPLPFDALLQDNIDLTNIANAVVTETANNVTASKGTLVVSSGTATGVRIVPSGTNGKALIENSGATGGVEFGTVLASGGGTGQTTYAKGDLLVGNATSGLDKLTVGATNGFALKVNSSATDGVDWGILPAAGGGTGQSTYSTGDLLIGNASAGLDKLTKGANDRYLHTNASTGALEWSTVTTGGGNVYGDASVTDNAICRFNADGYNIQDTTTTNVFIDDSGHLYPATDNQQNLGSTSASWMNLYLGGNLYLGTAEDAYLYRSAVSVVSTGSDDGFAIAGTQILTSARVLSSTTFGMVLTPDGDGTRDIGTSSASWKDLYLGGNLYFGTAEDAYLYRSAANVISTGASDALAIGGTTVIDGTGAWSGTKIPVSKGGTNTTSYTQGQIVYASAATDLTGITNPSATSNMFVCTNAGAGTIAYAWQDYLTSNPRFQGVLGFNAGGEQAYALLGSSSVYCGLVARYETASTATFYIDIPYTSGGGQLGTNFLDAISINTSGNVIFPVAPYPTSDNSVTLGTGANSWSCIYLGAGSPTSTQIRSDSPIGFYQENGTSRQTIDIASLSVGGTSRIDSNGYWVGQTVAVSRGGTGKANWTANTIAYASATDTLGELSPSAGCLYWSGSAYSWVTAITNPYAGNLRNEGTLGYDASGEKSYVLLGSATNYCGIVAKYESASTSTFYIDIPYTSGAGQLGTNWLDAITISTAGAVVLPVAPYPTSDNSVTLGTAANSWSCIYLGAGSPTSTQIRSDSTIGFYQENGTTRQTIDIASLSVGGTSTIDSNGYWVGQNIATSRGGTNNGTWTQGQLAYASASNVVSGVTNPTGTGQYLYCSNAGAGTIAYTWSAAWQGNTLTVAKGGTNNTSNTQGAIQYASAADTISGTAVPTVQYSLHKCTVATAGSIAYGFTGVTIDASDNIALTGNITPNADGTKNLGSASASYANAYIGTNVYLGTAEDAYIYRSAASVVSTGSDDGFAIAGTAVLTSARVLQNITGNITMFDAGTLTTARGGTGQTTWTQYNIPYLSTATQMSGITNPSAAGQLLYCSAYPTITYGFGTAIPCNPRFEGVLGYNASGEQAYMLLGSSTNYCGLVAKYEAATPTSTFYIDIPYTSGGGQLGTNWLDALTITTAGAVVLPVAPYPTSDNSVSLGTAANSWVCIYLGAGNPASTQIRSNSVIGFYDEAGTGRQTIDVASLSVGGTSRIDSSGYWVGQNIATSRGGTNQNTWTQYNLVYMSASNQMSGITNPTATGQVLYCSAYPTITYGWTTAMTGSTGANDHRLLRANGTGGSTVENTPITCDDSGNLSGVGTVGCGAITTTANLNLNTTSANIEVQGANAKRTFLLTAQGGYPRTSNGCSAPLKQEYSTNKQNFYTLDFDTAATEYAQWAFPTPYNWDGSTVTARFYWTCTGGSAAQTVRWCVQACSYDDNETIDKSWGTAQYVDDTWQANYYVHKTGETSAITVAGGSATAAEWIIFQVYRDVVNDNLSGDAKLIAVSIRYGIATYSD